MKLVSMKKTEEQKKEEMPSVYVESEYPYGLMIHLEDEQLEALGIKEVPAVGESFMLHAEAYVKSTEERNNEEDTDRRVCFQISAMSVEKSKEEKSIAKMMYDEE